MATLLQDALQARYLVLSSVGSHAGENWSTIVARKRVDIANARHSIWVVNSHAVRADALQAFCTEHDARYVIFLSRRPHGQVNAGPPTADRAQFYSEDGKTWLRLHRALSHVTGRLNVGTTGFWLDALEEMQGATLDLGCFRKERSLLCSRMASDSMVWAGSIRSSSSQRRPSPNAPMKLSRAFVRMARRGPRVSPTPWMISRRRREGPTGSTARLCFAHWSPTSAANRGSVRWFGR
jgi:hypothetical protein